MSDASQDLDAIEAALGRRSVERELEAREPEWEAVARGELELDEAIERRRAAGDDDATIERAAAYFRPFDQGETASLLDALLGPEGQAEAPEPPEPEAANVVPLRRVEPTPEAAPPKPKHDPGSSGFWWIPAGLLLASAAAIAMWSVWPPDTELVTGNDQQIALADPLPSYMLETDGGLKQLRSDSGSDPVERHRYRRDTQFEWILRPKVDEPGEIAVRGFAFVDGSRAGLPLPALAQLAQVAKSGAVRIKGTVDQLDLEPGRYTIALAVGRPADLPTQAAEVHEPAADAPWQVRRIDIDIEE